MLLKLWWYHNGPRPLLQALRKGDQASQEPMSFDSVEAKGPLPSPKFHVHKQHIPLAQLVLMETLEI